MGDDLAKAFRSLAQVAPCAENPALRHRDEFVPRLGVQAARSTGVVKRDIVLYRLEARELGREAGEFFALPILLEPAAVIAVHVEVDDEQPRDGGFGNTHIYCPCCL